MKMVPIKKVQELREIASARTRSPVAGKRRAGRGEAWWALVCCTRSRFFNPLNWLSKT